MRDDLKADPEVIVVLRESAGLPAPCGPGCRHPHECEIPERCIHLHDEHGIAAGVGDCTALSDGEGLGPEHPGGAAGHSRAASRQPVPRVPGRGTVPGDQ